MKRSWIKRKSVLKRSPKFKLHTYKSAKKRAWDMFSLYKRLKDCLGTTGLPDYGLCYTCGKRKHFKELQCGHFQQGRGNSILFDDTCHAQCYYCNCLKHGEQLIFRRRLVEEFGEQRVQLLENKRYQVKKYSIIELDALYCHYKMEYQNLGGKS